MNKLKHLCLSMMVLLLFSCESDPLHKSKINLKTDDFVITSIQKGSEAHIICSGFKKESEAFWVLDYDATLNYQKTTNLSNLAKFKGNVKLTSLQENGYLATCYLNQELPQRLMLYKTDVNFNVISEYEVARWNDTLNAVNVRVLQTLKNGDYIMAFDTMGRGLMFGGFKIQRFDKNLKPIFSYSDNVQNYVGSFSPLLAELPDESLFYIASTNNVKGSGGGPYKSIRTGCLTKSGTSLYENFTSVKYNQIHPIGLSVLNNQIIYQMKVNNDLIHFLSIDFNTGNIIQNKEMSYNEVNHFNQYGAFLNDYPLTSPSEILIIGEANPMPANILFNQGQVLFTKATGKLFHLTIDNQLDFHPTFDVTLPMFDEINSYRQLYLDNGKMVVGSSYIYQGKPYFNIQMLNMDGTVFQ